jgi:transposase
LFIDTTNIENEYGRECVNYGQNKKKQICKLSVIADEEHNIFGVTLHDGNVADIKTVVPSLTNIVDKFKYRKINSRGRAE